MDNDENLNSTKLPLCVDMDGTLLRTDVMIEMIWRSLWQRPFALFCALFALFRGRAHFKQKLSTIGWAENMHLPFNNNFLIYLRKEYQQGRKLYLVTAADHKIAKKIADKLKIFTGIWASDGYINLKGIHKAKKLEHEFGKDSFAYAGNSHADLPVWLSAKEAIIVNAGRQVENKLKNIHAAPMPFDKKKNFFITLCKAIRIHQWAKNILLFIPLIVGHYYGDLRNLSLEIIAFISFSFITSSVYVLNDLLDLDTDRRHHSKRHRAIAAGDIPLSLAIGIWIGFFIFSVLIAFYIVGSAFLTIMLYYYAIASFYSLYLKKQRYLDILTLVLLYTLRIFAGAVAISVPISPWLIAFFLVFFLSLTLIKRYTELHTLKTIQSTKMLDKKYQINDLQAIKYIGVGASSISAILLAFYINSPNVSKIYQHQQWLWSLVFLTLLGLTYLWRNTEAGKIDEDPVLYTLKNKVCWLLGILAIVCLHMAY